jgi:hypothetical protein
MQTLYEKILDKPKSYRRKLSYAITAILGVLIFAVWLMITIFSMRNAFDFEDTTEDIKNSFSEEFEAPSFYEEEETKSLEENFDTLMDQEKETELSTEKDLNLRN